MVHLLLRYAILWRWTEKKVHVDCLCIVDEMLRWRSVKATIKTPFNLNHNVTTFDEWYIKIG